MKYLALLAFLPILSSACGPRGSAGDCGDCDPGQVCVDGTCQDPDDAGVDAGDGWVAPD